MADIPNRRSIEADIAAAILLLWEDEQRRLIAELQARGEVSAEYWRGAQDRTGAAVLALLLPVYEAGVARLRGQFEPFPLDAVTVAAAAADHAAELAAGILANTRAAIEEADGADALAATLALAFGSSRADAIAITELTAGNSRAEGLVRRGLERVGVSIIPFWNTVGDGRVCPVCAPLNNQRIEIWEKQFPNGPPGHPRCRCWLDWRTV